MSIEALLHAIIWLAVVGLIFYVLWWALGKIALPEPFNKVATVLLVVIGAVVIIYFLLGMIGSPPQLRLR